MVDYPKTGGFGAAPRSFQARRLIYDLRPTTYELGKAPAASPLAAGRGQEQAADPSVAYPGFHPARHAHHSAGHQVVPIGSAWPVRVQRVDQRQQRHAGRVGAERPPPHPDRLKSVLFEQP